MASFMSRITKPRLSQISMDLNEHYFGRDLMASQEDKATERSNQFSVRLLA